MDLTALFIREAFIWGIAIKHLTVQFLDIGKSCFATKQVVSKGLVSYFYGPPAYSILQKSFLKMNDMVEV